MSRLVVATIFFMIFSSCFKSADLRTGATVEVEQIAEEQSIPKALMLKVDEEFKEEFKFTAPIYTFIPLKVVFNEQGSGVVRNAVTRYNFPKGGGLVDLKDVINAEGSFYMSFPPEQFDKNNELLHLYFVSNSPRSKIGAEVFGLGCGKWVDIKSDFKKLTRDDFLKLNTNELRYLRVLAGTYVFIFRQAKSIYMTQLTLTDSRFTNELCNGGST